jgi:hypothetical protein
MQFTLKSHPKIIIPSLELLYLFGAKSDEAAAQVYAIAACTKISG